MERIKIRINHFGEPMDFDATPVDIVKTLRDEAMMWEGKSLAEYVAWVCANLRRIRGIVLEPQGNDDETLARSFVSELRRVGLAEPIPAAPVGGCNA